MGKRKTRIIIYTVFWLIYMFFGFPQILSRKCNPCEEEAKNTLVEIVKSIELYFSDHNTCPNNLKEIRFKILSSHCYRYSLEKGSKEYTFKVTAVSKGWTYPSIVDDGGDVWEINQDFKLKHIKKECRGAPMYNVDYVFFLVPPFLILIEIIIWAASRLIARGKRIDQIRK